MNAQAESLNDNRQDRRKIIVVLFGTRPEIIKLTPVIRELQTRDTAFRTLVVNSGQHIDLLAPFLVSLEVKVDQCLEVMKVGQTSTELCSRVLAAFDQFLTATRPHLVLVQGDTTTALAGALAAFHHQIPVGHVEAGLRSFDLHSPFPEEMNRRLITQLATYHFAPTQRNRANLLSEGVASETVIVTGNPGVDALNAALKQKSTSAALNELLQATSKLRRLVLTAHRRESFPAVLPANLQVIRAFIENHDDVCLFFPVHPNPAVRTAVQSLLPPHPRIHLLPPLDYNDFLSLLSGAWLILSDSGGIQEEVPTLGKVLLILRDTTERPEIIEAGVARLVGTNSERLRTVLEEVYLDDRWIQDAHPVANPFGAGDSATRIVAAIAGILTG